MSDELLWYRNGKRIYYLIEKGKVLYDAGEGEGTVYVEKSFDFDYDNVPDLNKYQKESIGYIDLEYGQYAQEFSKCISYQINISTKMIEFIMNYGDTQRVTIPLERRIEELESALLIQLDKEIGGIL